MTSELAIFHQAPLPAAPPPVTRDLAEVQTQARERVRELLEATTAASTKKAYLSDWSHFTEWCAALGVTSLPAEVGTLIAFLSELPTMPQNSRQGRGTRKTVKLGYSVASIERRLATISARHKEAGLDNPCAHPHVHKLLRGIRREIGTAPRRKAALLTEHLRPFRRPAETILEIRDRALILVGFAGAFRRSELVGLNLADCEFGERTVTMNLRRSKTDQEGRGRRVVIHAGGSLCPIVALKAWLQAANIETGAVFRSIRKGGSVGARLSTEGVAIVVKRHAAARGLEAADFGGHSLRAGHVTQAILRGEAAHAIMAVTGHQSRAMVDRYFRDVEPHRHNSSANLGL